VSGRAWSIVLAVLVVPIVLVALYLWIVLSWSYSDGERAGILQKISRKGWICKTIEGELAISIVPGVTPIIWDFTVRNESLVPALEAALGKRVALHYTEHRGLPTSCFGETTYFVNSIRVVE
jgi:hypothetical protein